MTKQGLQTGMLVQHRDGEVFMVIGDFAYSNTKFISLRHYSDDISIKDDGNCDIMKVSKPLEGNMLIPKYWTEETLNNNLLWEREENEEAYDKKLEQKEYTMEELTKIVGHNFKIKK